MLRLKMALHVLRGRPIMHGMTVQLSDAMATPSHALIVGNTIIPPS